MEKLPRLCFVGAMLGGHPGCVPTQGEFLAHHFASAGYDVISVSTSRNRYIRLIDIISTLILRSNEVDIQCLQVFGGRSFIVEDIASWIGRSLGQRLVMILRGGAMPEFMARYPAWTSRVLRRANIIVAPSAFLARAVARLGFTACVIPNVLDLSKYRYKFRRELAPRLFWMRSFHPIYNPEMAVRVLARLRRIAPEGSLVIAGQNRGTQDKVRHLAHRFGLDGSVHFPGYLDTAAKLQHSDAADIFLNTNRIDNVPVSVMEACASGLPVIATNVGGIADLLTDQETALLVPDDDDEAMAAAIVRLLENPELAGRLSTNGRTLAETFSWNEIRPRWVNLFNEVMARPKTTFEAHS